VCRSHAGLHRAERMLDCLATQAHGLCLIEDWPGALRDKQ
jgi:hypothetical protein